MSDLTEWLLEQIAGEETDMRSPYANDRVGHAGRCVFEGGYEGTHDCDCGAVDFRLAELAAKRAIIDEHAQGVYVQPTGRCQACMPSRLIELNGRIVTTTDHHYPCLTLRHLAQPYAARPGYREEWRP